MNLLVVSQYFWPESFRINDLVIGLHNRGHKITILTGLPNYPEGHLYPGYSVFTKRVEYFNGIKVIRAPLITRGGKSRLRLALNYLSFAFFASIMAPLFCRGEFDLIFVYEPSPITVGLPAIVLKKLTSAPIMFWVQDLWPESLSATGSVRSSFIIRIIEKLVRFIYSHCDRILVQSKSFYLPIENQGVSREKIYYYPNSAEALYQNITIQSDSAGHLGIPEGFCIMFAGNIGAAQDFDTILAAAEKLKSHHDLHWVILGSGRMSAWVESEVQRRLLSKNFHMLGRHPVEAMPRFFAHADVMLVSLKKAPIFSLTIPSKIQSYLACGKPIVAALEGEGARIIEEAGAGLICSPEDADSLAEAVLSIYHLHESEREAMGTRGSNYFKKHFEHNLLLDRLEIWMNELKKNITPAIQHANFIRHKQPLDD